MSNSDQIDNLRDESAEVFEISPDSRLVAITVAPGLAYYGEGLVIEMTTGSGNTYTMVQTSNPEIFSIMDAKGVLRREWRKFHPDQGDPPEQFTIDMRETYDIIPNDPGKFTRSRLHVGRRHILGIREIDKYPATNPVRRIRYYRSQPLE